MESCDTFDSEFRRPCWPPSWKNFFFTYFQIPDHICDTPVKFGWDIRNSSEVITISVWGGSKKTPKWPSCDFFRIWRTRVNKIYVGFKYPPKGLNYIPSSVERLQLLRDPAMFTFSKNKQFPGVKIYLISICSRMWAIEHGLEPCMLSFISYLFQMFASNMYGFKFDFSKKILGRGSPSPHSRHFSRFSRASPSPSARAPPSILRRFAPLTLASPSILGRFAPSIRASPSAFDWRTGLVQPK